MYNHDRRPSDVDSLSSITSDVTSRATTIPNSWSATALQDKLQQLAQFNIRPMDDDESSISDVTTTTNTTARDVTVVSRSTDTLGDAANTLNSLSTLNTHPPPSQQLQQQQQPQQQQQQSWVNPYWGPNSDTNSTATQSEARPPTSHAGEPPASQQQQQQQQHVKQLIPGSILINDQGEIDDLLWKRNNTELNSSTSSASFNPGGQYISDESGGVGGFLAPTHTQRRSAPRSISPSVPSASEKPPAQKVASPTPTSQVSQTWVNPYWPNSNVTTVSDAPTKSPSPAKPSSPTNKLKPGSVKSHYVNTNPTQLITAATNEPWQNPYWKDNKDDHTKASRKQSVSDSNSNRSMSSSHKIPPVPSFYQRIYPPPSPVSFSSPSSLRDATFSTRKSELHAHDDDDLPYTLDSHNVVRYRAATSNPQPSKNISSTASTRRSPQYPLPVTPKSNPSPTSLQLTSLTTQSYPTHPPITQSSRSSKPSPRASRYDIPGLPTSVTVLTEEDLNSIHNALRLLETNPNAIPLVSPSNRIPSPVHRPPAANPLAAFTALLRPQPAAFSPNVQLHSQQPPPLFSTPSYPGNVHDSFSRMTQRGNVVLI